MTPTSIAQREDSENSRTPDLIETPKSARIVELVGASSFERELSLGEHPPRNLRSPQSIDTVNIWLIKSALSPVSIVVSIGQSARYVSNTLAMLD